MWKGLTVPDVEIRGREYVAILVEKRTVLGLVLDWEMIEVNLSEVVYRNRSFWSGRGVGQTCLQWENADGA